jgi:pseudaminic acid cytidylyltransferase
MSLCIIPARGGSKRIPRKNIKRFSGKPIIAYAIEVAKNSSLFEHIIVSTDDDEIAAVARNFGAETPFKRVRELADDHTPTVPVIASAIEECNSLGWQFDFVCCIYPCVPFINPEDLKDALELLKRSDADYAFPILEYSSTIQRAMRRDLSGRVESVYPDNELVRTQDLEPTYHDAGQFYWGHRSAWLKNTRIHSSAVGLVIPRTSAVDIDTEQDWIFSEVMYEANKKLIKD